MAISVLGIGVVCARGRGMDRFEAALRQGWAAPAPVQIPYGAAACPAYLAPPEVFVDKTALRKSRRADRLSKMAVLAACDAWQAGALPAGAAADTGLILATAFGPHVTTFAFLDEILDYGDPGVSPTVFSHSVHDAAAAYVSMTLELRGPSLTLTQFAFPFHQALLLAQAWLAERRCRHVLVGAAEEAGAVLHHVCRLKTPPPADGRIRPFAFSRAPAAVPGEGSAFLLLSAEPAAQAWCELERIAFDAPPRLAEPADLQLLEADGMAADETAYAAAVLPGVPLAGYAPLFGSMLCGSAFHAAAAALMLRGQTRFASPVPDNPHGLDVCAETAPAKLHRIVCTRCACGPHRADMCLKFARPC